MRWPRYRPPPCRVDGFYGHCEPAGSHGKGEDQPDDHVLITEGAV
jgi:hypothetical protein